MSQNDPFDAANGRRQGEIERLRAGLLRLKSQLHDRVTGLDAYQLHVDRLNSLSDGGPVGVIAVDFPGLTALEAAYGWEMSDRFLAGAAEALSGLCGQGLPPSAILSLDGVHGDCFLVFLPDNGRGESADTQGVADFCALLDRHLMERLRHPDGGAQPRIDHAVGHALVSAAPAARFERRLHEAIREARAMTLRQNDRRLDVRGEELRSILKAGTVRTHYQPIVDMEQGTIMGYEALTRGPENSVFERADALFAGGLASDLLPELDRLCRCEAVRNARGFDPHKKLFVNSLPESLGAPGFIHAALERALEENALKPRNLVLEITERTSIHDFEAFGRELGPLRRQGFLVAIDDVGTGYSSLQTITEVQPDFLKIDLSLIKGIHRSLLKQDLVRSLLQAGSRIQAQVIAEGIETEDEYRTLRRCGVRYGQGYYFARPAPPYPVLAQGGQ